MKVEERIRKRRRDATLGAAFADLERDLDEVRSALGESLADFEQKLRRTTDSLPKWLDEDPENLRELFCIEVDDAEPVTIGPRAAALGAATVEAFVIEHVSPEKAALRHGFDEAAADAWGEELDSVADRLDEIERLVRAAASDAERELGARLEAALADLESDRETREEELRREVADGSIAAGEQARKMEARLWEEQRRRASAVRETWTELEELPFEAAGLTVDAIARLRKLLESAVDAVVVAYPELRQAAGDWAKPTGKRVRRINLPPPIPKKRDPTSPSFEVDDARRVTEPIEPTETHEYEREVGVPTRPDTDPPRTAEPTPSPAASPADVATYDEPTYRVTRGWDTVHLGEIALVVFPPLAYVGFLLATTIAFHLGALAENPFRQWHWAFPIFVGAAVYLVGMPAFMSWRVRWSGWRPRVVRYRVARQDSFLRVSSDLLTVASARVALPCPGARLTRWRFAGERGWCLVVPSEEGELTLSASASDRLWRTSDTPIAATKPGDAWQLSEDTLHVVARRATRNSPAYASNPSR